jgi:hypothetical protein
MARNNTENNSARAMFNGVEVVVIRRGDKNSRVRLPAATKGDSFLVETAKLSDWKKIEKVKVVTSLDPSNESADPDQETVTIGASDVAEVSAESLIDNEPVTE